MDLPETFTTIEVEDALNGGYINLDPTAPRADDDPSLRFEDLTPDQQQYEYQKFVLPCVAAFNACVEAGTINKTAPVNMLGNDGLESIALRLALKHVYVPCHGGLVKKNDGTTFNECYPIPCYDSDLWNASEELILFLKENNAYKEPETNA